MKKLFITLSLMVFGLILPANANTETMPVSSESLQHTAIGMYQVPKHVVIHEKADAKSKVVYEANWDYEKFKASSGNEYSFFSVLIPKKELGFIQVTDFTEDWIKVVYNKERHLTGWLQAEDLRFMMWRNFYGIYGRKYGLFIFDDKKTTVKDLYSGTDENSQIVDTITTKVVKIKLTAIKGNWALVTVLDTNNTAKTGYMRWRTDDGELNMFPAIK